MLLLLLHARYRIQLFFRALHLGSSGRAALTAVSIYLNPLDRPRVASVIHSGHLSGKKHRLSSLSVHFVAVQARSFCCPFFRTKRDRASMMLTCLCGTTFVHAGGNVETGKA
jgi:hypothetical protein